MSKFRVLLVDDDELLLESLEIILSLKGDMEIVGKAQDGKQALELLAERDCDIALVDLNMKGMGGIELIPIMKGRYEAVKVLVLTTFYDDANISAAIKSGADGYLLKDSGSEAILRAVNDIMSGRSILDAKVMQRLSELVTGVSKQQEKKKLPPDLTPKELELCAMLQEGYTNVQIASRMYISEGTVKNYVSSIYDKMGIHNRGQLVAALHELM